MSSVLEQFRLNGKLAVVTGAFGKLGSIWTRALLEAGGRVAAVDLPTIQPSQAQQELQARYEENNLRFFGADITAREDLLQTRQAIETQFNASVEIVVNNAGIDQPPGKPSRTYLLQDFPQDLFEQVLSVNLTGAFQVMQVFGERMVEKQAGSIINIGSLYASVSPDVNFYSHIEVDPPFLKPPVYGASKAALLNLTHYFATHWGPRNVRINMLSPGGVEGGQDTHFKSKFCARTPLGRMAEADDLTAPLLFLASDASRYITGLNLKVDGGFTLW